MEDRVDFQTTEQLERRVNQLEAQLRQLIDAEHKDNGMHEDVTADSLRLQGANVGEIVEVAYDSARFSAAGGGAWIVGSNEMTYVRYSRIGQLIFVQFSVESSELTGTPDSLVVNMPDLHALPTLRRLSSGPALQVCGSLEYNDLTNGTEGMGTVSALAENFIGTPTTAIYLTRWKEVVDAAGFTVILQDDWDVSTDFYIIGSAWFMAQPNNVPTVFFGS